jgi:hypothetical protein
LNVVDPQGNPVIGFRWLLEEDTTTWTLPGTVQVNPPSIGLDIINSYAPVVQKGNGGAGPEEVPKMKERA